MKVTELIDLLAKLIENEVDVNESEIELIDYAGISHKVEKVEFQAHPYGKYSRLRIFAKY